MKPTNHITPIKLSDSFFINELMEDASGRWKNKKTPGIKAQPVNIDETTMVFELMKLLNQ